MEKKKLIHLRLTESLLEQLEIKRKEFGYITRTEFVRDLLRFIIVADMPIVKSWLEQAKRYMPFNNKEKW